jgi:hypothetical protein
MEAILHISNSGEKHAKYKRCILDIFSQLNKAVNPSTNVNYERLDLLKKAPDNSCFS